MKKLVLNDSRQIEVQSASAADGVFHARFILTTAESLKALFQDKFATQKMTLFENQMVTEDYENYTEFQYIKEEVGGIFEVELRQKEADTSMRLNQVEEQSKENALNLEMAIAELTMVIAEMTATMGGVADV